jgi:hypothetical protein
MSTIEDVANLLRRLSPAPACDDCVAERLALAARQVANQRTRELAGSHGFERRRDICSLCFGEKIVTRWIKPAS